MINIKFKIKESGTIDSQIKEFNDNLCKYNKIVEQANICKQYIKKCNIISTFNELKITSDSSEFYSKVNKVDVINNKNSILLFLTYEFNHNGEIYKIYDRGSHIMSLGINTTQQIWLQDLINKISKLKKNKIVTKEVVMKELVRKYITMCSQENLSPNLHIFKNSKYNYNTAKYDVIEVADSEKYMEYFKKYTTIC